MKNSLVIKFVAVTLCALMLLGAAASGVGLLGLAAADLLGDKSFQQLYDEYTFEREGYLADSLATWWASGEYGDMPQELVDAYIQTRLDGADLERSKVFYAILDEDGKELYSNLTDETIEKTLDFKLESVSYERFLGYGEEGYDAFKEKEDPDGEKDAYVRSFWDHLNGTHYQYGACQENGPGVQVRLYLAPGAQKMERSWLLLERLYRYQGQMEIALAVCLLLFAAFAVYLCSSAGHRPGSKEVKAGGLNALPLDLYGAGIVLLAAFCVWIAEDAVEWLIEQSWNTMLLCAGTVGYVCCLAFVGFCFAFAAQVKMPGYYWWWNSICGRALRLGLWILKAVFRVVCQVIPWLWKQFCRLVKDLWKIAAALLTLLFGMLKKIWRWTVRQLRRFCRVTERFFSMLPLTWQWLGGGAVMVLLLALTLSGDGGYAALGVILSFALVLYGAYGFGTLMDGAKKMRGGDLEHKVDGKFLIGSFREFAGELNGLADVAMQAAQKQLKSDRMKTELITNVSHDIKTPLTSIINYVDLLEMPHTPEQEKTYLEVLSRQSQRMKKLIEDLMEMSKASTGNIPVEIAEIDAVEAVNQALGEFADKLTAAGLTPVFRQSEESVFLLADGRLLWRAMSNVLSNAVKYSLPGTRLYVDVTAAEDKAVISFKNISGAALNISAEELLERFVRGDSSRNTEGSGLGLNIAKSLMELQKGELELLVDGDLFKVTLVFPRAGK